MPMQMAIHSIKNHAGKELVVASGNTGQRGERGLKAEGAKAVPAGAYQEGGGGYSVTGGAAGAAIRGEADSDAVQPPAQAGVAWVACQTKQSRQSRGSR